MGKPSKKEKRKARESTSATELRNGDALFVAAYLANGGNATRAYLSVHPDAKESTAAVEGWRALRKPKVAEAVLEGRSEMLQRHAMEGDEALALIALRARADLAEALDEDGRWLPLRQLPASIRLCVKAVRRNKDGERELVFHDALKAAELMAVATGKLRSKLDVAHQFDHLELLAGTETPPEEKP